MFPVPPIKEHNTWFTTFRVMPFFDSRSVNGNTTGIGNWMSLLKTNAYMGKINSIIIEVATIPSVPEVLLNSLIALSSITLI